MLGDLPRLGDLFRLLTEPVSQAHFVLVHQLSKTPDGQNLHRRLKKIDDLLV